MKLRRLDSISIWQRDLVVLSAWLVALASLVWFSSPLFAFHQQTAAKATPAATKPQPGKTPDKPGAAPTLSGSPQTLSASSSGGSASLSSFSIQSFNADLFTGSSGAEIPIVVPPGAAGVTPAIVLRYNSGVDDDLGDLDQAEWTGLGWSLDIGGFVIRDAKGTTSTGDDSFKLVFGGEVHDLIDIGGGNYRTKDETFLQITFASGSDYWTVRTKDGTTHRFGYNTDSKATGLTFATNVEVAITFRYFIDEVSTPSGVAIRYSYFKQSSSYNSKAYDQAVYPDTITYAYRNNSLVDAAREIRFLRGARSDWTDVSGSQHTSYHELYRLDAVEVKVGTALVRRYNFNYDYSIDRTPGQNWGGGASGDLTLTSVTMLGADGASPLPPFTFTYTGPVLATAANGMGAMVSYVYEYAKVTNPINLMTTEDGDGQCRGQILSIYESSCGTSLYGRTATDAVLGDSAAPIYLVPNEDGDGNCTMSYHLGPSAGGSCGGSLYGYASVTTERGATAPLYLALTQQ